MTKEDYLGLRATALTYIDTNKQLFEARDTVKELESEVSIHSFSKEEFDDFQRKTESLANLLDSVEPRLIEDRHNRARVVVVPATLSYDLSEFYSPDEIGQLQESGIPEWQLKGLCKYKPSNPDKVKIIPEASIGKFVYNGIKNLPRNFSNGDFREKGNYIVMGGMFATLGIVNPVFFSCAAIGAGVLLKYVIRVTASENNPFSKRADQLRNELNAYTARARGEE